MTVKLWTVDTHKPGSSSDRYAACSAHTRAVHHDGVERDVRGYVVFLCQQTAELHHYGGTDGKALVHLLAQYHLFHTHSDYTFLTVTAVIGHNDNLVRMLAHLFLEDYQFLGPTCKHRHHFVARCLECFYYRQHGSHAHTAAGTKHSAVVVYFCSLTERTHHIRDKVTLAQTAKFRSGISNRLNHQCDGTLLYIRVRYGQWYSLSLITYAHYNEMSGTAAFGNQWRFHYQFEYLFGELLLLDYLVHNG